MYKIFKILIKFPYRMICLIWNFFQLKRYNTVYFPSLKINGRIYISGQNINIGKNVRINSCSKSNPIGGDSRTILRTCRDGRIIIGNNVGISNSAIVSYSGIKINDNVLIGNSCKIYDTDFHSLNITDRIKDSVETIKSVSIEIGEGVFIGAHSIILKGVVIGENSVIGAGSVITKSIPANEIWGGNPAQYIRKL